MGMLRPSEKAPPHFLGWQQELAGISGCTGCSWLCPALREMLQENWDGLKRGFVHLWAG